MAGASADGSIYVGNLTTLMSGTSPYKIYRWVNEAAAPTTAISTSTVLAGSRLGDDLSLFDTGTSTLLAAGFNSSPSVAGNNGYAVMDIATASANAISSTAWAAVTGSTSAPPSELGIIM